MAHEKKDPSTWNADEVADFVCKAGGLSDIADILLKNDVNGALLLGLKMETMKEELEIKSYGKRMKLMNIIKELRGEVGDENEKHTMRLTGKGEATAATENPRDDFYSGVSTEVYPSAKNSRHFRSSFMENSNDELESTSTFEDPPMMPMPSRSHESSGLLPATFKLADKTNEFSLGIDEARTADLAEKDLEMAIGFAAEEDKSDNPDETPKFASLSVDEDDFAPVESDTILTTETVEVASVTKDLADLSISCKLRSYQEELLMKIKEAEANGHNAIVCAPTGSGKTLVAASYCADFIMRARAKAAGTEQTGCVYFFVPTVHLVDQQTKFIESSVKNCRVGKISGDHKQKTTLCEQTDISDVVVMTPMILVEAMKVRDPQVKLSDVSLMIFDECHHTEREHPYMQVMDIYFKQKFESDETSRDDLPRVLGMTATLGVGSTSNPNDAQSHMLTLCANLNSPEIIKVVKNCDVLYQYVSHPDTEILSVGKRPMEDPFSLEAAKMMTEIQRKTGMLEKPYDYGSHEYETTVHQHRKTLEEKGDHEALFYVKMLINFNKALQVYQDMGKIEALDSLSRAFSDVVTEAEGKSKLVGMIQNERQSNIDRLQHLKAVHSLPNPKLDALKDCLLKEFKKFKKPKGIVFMKTRELTSYLVQWIKNDDKLSTDINPMRLVGEGSELKDQITKVEQLQAIRSFGSNKCNLLVATTIGEEGLDIPECNYVIRYEIVTSEVAEVQARGRARVRLHASHFVEIVTRGSVNESHARANKYREKLMDEASNAIQHLPKHEILNEIHKRQMERRKQLEKKAEQLKVKRQSSRSADVQLTCLQCGVVVCQASDVIRVETNYVVPGDCLDTKMKIDRTQTEPKYNKVGKIYCKECGKDWGVLTKFKSAVDLPTLKCSSFLFKISGKTKSFKKWKDVPFEVYEGSEDDL